MAGYRYVGAFSAGNACGRRTIGTSNVQHGPMLRCLWRQNRKPSPQHPRVDMTNGGKRSAINRVAASSRHTARQARQGRGSAPGARWRGWSMSVARGALQTRGRESPSTFLLPLLARSFQKPQWRDGDIRVGRLLYLRYCSLDAATDGGGPVCKLGAQKWARCALFPMVSRL